MTKVAILNSRQSKTPVGNDAWVRQTVAAVRYAAENGWTVISSVGMNTLELVTWAAGHHAVGIEIVAPESWVRDADDEILRDFELKSTGVVFNTLGTKDSSRSGKSWWADRDRVAIERADVLLPVSVRAGGQLATLLRDRRPDQIVDERFAISYKRQPHHARQLVDTGKLSEAIRQWDGDWIIHWTRACHGPWPAEISAAFYSDLAQSGDHYCRTACHTLRRILEEKLIRGSNWRTAGSQVMAAFTELSPLESLPLMRWRVRWARWSFEPYGIAIRKDWAEKLGGRRVRYVTEAEWRDLSDTDKPFAHRIGTKTGEWPSEREWRIRGDVTLSEIPADCLRVIVRHESERDLIRGLTECEVFAFQNE